MASVYAETQGQLLRPSEAPCVGSKQRRQRRHDNELVCPAALREGSGRVIGEWLQTLGTAERQLVFVQENTWVTAMLRQMFSRKLRDGDVIFTPFIRTSRFESSKLEDYFTLSRPDSDPASCDTEFEQQLRLCDSSQYLDSLTLSWELINDSSRLIRLFETVTQGEAFKYPCMAYWDSCARTWAWESPHWTAGKSLTLSQFAAAMLEKVCWTRYYEWSHLDPRISYDFPPFLSDPRPVSSSLQDLPALTSFWKSSPPDKKSALIGDIPSLTSEYHLQKQSHQDLIRRNNEITALITYQTPNFLTLFANPSVYYCSLRGKTQYYMSPISLDQLLTAGLEAAAGDYIDYLVKTPLERAGTVHDMVARGVFGRIKEALTAQVAADLLQTEEKSTFKPNIKRKNSKKKQKRVSSNASTTASPSSAQGSSQKLSETAGLEAAKFILEGLISTVGAHIEATESGTTFQTVKSGRKRCERQQKHPFAGGNYRAKRGKKSTAKVEIPSVTCRSGPVSPVVIKWAVGEEKQCVSFQPAVDFPPLSTGTMSSWGELSKELAEFQLEVHQSMTQKGQLMMWIIGQLGEAISDLFPGAYISLFGSYATGLALPSSDLDLAVLNAALFHEDITQSMTMLEEVLPAYPWVVSVKAIATASIPVVKLTINPMGSGEGDLVQVDITFEDEGGRHMGVAACDWVLELISRFPQCQECFLPLKQLLLRHSLNSTYHGGLSSYGLLLWLSAYIHTHPDLTGGELFLGFLKFYGTQFNPKTTGITTISPDKQVYYPRPQPAFTLCETVDPLRPDNNTTKGAYRVAEVLQLFRKAYDFLMACGAHGQGRLLRRLLTRVDLIKQ